MKMGSDWPVMAVFHQLRAAYVKLAPSLDCRLLDRHVSAVSVEWTAKVQGWLSALEVYPIQPFDSSRPSLSPKRESSRYSGGWWVRPEELIGVTSGMGPTSKMNKGRRDCRCDGKQTWSRQNSCSPGRRVCSTRARNADAFQRTIALGRGFTGASHFRSSQL